MTMFPAVYQAHVIHHCVTYYCVQFCGITEVLLANVYVTLEQACQTRNRLAAKYEI
jgi:hypothetical protein